MWTLSQCLMGIENSCLSLISSLSLQEYQFSWCTVSTSDIAFLPFVVTVTPCSAGLWPSFFYRFLCFDILLQNIPLLGKIAIRSAGSFRALECWCGCGGARCQPSVPAHRRSRILMANDKTSLTLQGFHAFKDAHLGALFKASGV